MPDTKITALTALTAADPANDVLPIVDVSDTTMAASGTTKKISINNVLGCSGTATLASATITGDLTVDTSTLKVDSANNRVGINTASPQQAFEVVAAGINTIFNTASAADSRFELRNNNVRAGYVYWDTSEVRLFADTSRALTFYQNGTLGMTLNSTGLGVGVSPSYKLDVNGVARVSSGGDGVFLSSASSPDLYVVGVNYYNNNGTEGVQVSARPSWRIEHKNSSDALAYLDIGFRAASAAASAFTSRFKIDGSGNVGIGVTPSAWGGSYKALQLQSVARNIAATGAGLGDFTVAFNAIYDSTDSRWEYAGTGDKAGRYSQTGSGNHRWFVSNTAGTAGNEITDFASAAMTLDASGNLLVGTTGQNGSWNTKLTLSNDSGTTKWAVGPYLGGVTNFIISAGASTGVYLNGTAATSWTSASDERLKDIIEPISNAASKVASLRAVIGKFKFDENNTRKPFLIAQDIQAVLPEAVDASNPDRLGVAYTDVIPLLVAAIKELTTRVQTLEAR